MSNQFKVDQLGVCSAGNLIKNLWIKASDNLNQDELAWFSDASEVARDGMRNLSSVLMNVGCLVNADRNNTGCLQDSEGISSLLFGLSHQIDVLAALVSISDAANFKLLHPESCKTNAHKKTA